MKGEVAHWLPTALTLLRDSQGQISNREIARRMAISHAILTRNETFQRARDAYPGEQKKRRRKGKKLRVKN